MLRWSQMPEAERPAAPNTGVASNTLSLAGDSLGYMIDDIKAPEWMGPQLSSTLSGREKYGLGHGRGSSVCYALAVGSSIMGLRLQAVMIDDILKPREGEMSNRKAVQTIKHWLQAELIGRSSLGTKITTCLSRVGYHDLDAVIEEIDDGQNNWYVSTIRQIADEDDILGRAPGDTLHWLRPNCTEEQQQRWHEIDIARVALLKRSTTPSIWQSQWQNDPSPALGSEIFNVDVMRAALYEGDVPPYVRKVPTHKTRLGRMGASLIPSGESDFYTPAPTWVAFDMALGREQGCDSVGAVLRFKHDQQTGWPHFYIDDVAMWREYDPREILAQCKLWKQHYGPALTSPILFEDAGGASFITGLLKNNGVRSLLVPATSRYSKVDRAKSWGMTWASAGQVHIRDGIMFRGVNMTEKVLLDMKQAPTGDMDTIDAIGLGITMAASFFSPNTGCELVWGTSAQMLARYRSKQNEMMNSFETIE
jgi:hypothetical protein